MFQQLIPLLRQRSVLLTVTAREHDQIRVNILPKKLAEGENTALTTPMSFTGTAQELDSQLPDAIVSYVSSYLELKNTLDRAKEEMAAAAKLAQEEARNKSKAAKKPTPVVAPVKKEESKAAEPPKAPSLFDMSAPPTSTASDAGDGEDEAEILAEIAGDDQTEEDEEQELMAAS
jgi:PRTRC genetic system protein E